MTEQKKVHYTPREIRERFFPEYESDDHFRREVLPRLIAAGFPDPAPYSTPKRLFFNKRAVDRYFNPPDTGPEPGAELGQPQPDVTIDWSAEAIRRALGPETEGEA